MNLRHGVALLCLVLLFLLLPFRGGDTGAGGSVIAQENGDAKKKKPKKANVGRMMRTCGKCHMNVKSEWERSGHSRAWTNPVFQAAIADRDDGGDACARCHAPDSVIATGPGNVPRAREADRELGVNCLSCHVRDKKYYGPIPSEGHKGIQVAEEYRSAKWCQSCHGQPELTEHDHFTSYREGPAAKEGATCQKCHMPGVVRQLASSKKRLKKLQPAQQCRQHLFAIPTVDGKPRGAATVTARFEGEGLVVELKPHGGHSLLVGPGRHLLLEVFLEDDSGEKVGSPRYHKFKPGDEAEFLRCKTQKIQFACKDQVKAARMELIRVDEIVAGRELAKRTVLATARVSR